MSTVKTQVVIEGKNNAKPAFDQASKQLSSLSSEAKAAGAVLAGVFSVGAFAAWVQSSLDAADAASKAAAAAGMSVEQYTALQYAADLAGVSVSGLDGALAKFNRTIAKAAAGGDAQLASFEKIGISISGAGGQLKSTDQLLAEVADRFQAMPDGAQKTALAMDLFGKSGAKLIPFLNAGAQGLAELKAEAEALGVVISGEQAAQSEIFNDNITRVGQAAQGAANQIAGEMLPTLVDLSDLMVDVNKNTEASSVVATVLAGGLKVLASAAIIVGDAFGSLGRFIGGAAAAAVSAAQGKFTEAADIMRQVGEDNARETGLAMERVSKLWEGAGEAAAKAATEQKEIELQREADFSTHVENIGELQKQQVRDAKEALRERLAAERSAKAEVEKLRKEQLDTEKRYKEAIAQLGGARDGGASYGQAQSLKVKAREALKAGDLASAKRNAQAALDVLLKLQEAGENTYGFEGFARELQSIEQEADRISLGNAEKTAAAAAEQVRQLKSAIDAVKDVKVTAELSEEDAAKLVSRMQALAAEIGQTMVIPVTVVPAPASGQASGVASADIPGHATGGLIRGPGTGTSDSVLARLSNGEYVVRAAAVRQYGTHLLDRINGMQMPAFADGGLVSSIQPQSAPSLGTINLMLDGQQYSLRAEEQDFSTMLRRQRMKRGSTRS